MNDTGENSGRAAGERYASPAMLERRKRILTVARELVSEQGIDGFSVDLLCRRADIARQTLYNAFKSKEGVIAAAILDYFEEYEARIPYRSPVGTLDRLIERIVAVGNRNLAIRNYIGAITEFYFSSTAGIDLRGTMRGIFSSIQQPYVKNLAESGSLHPWITEDRLIEAMDEQRMVVAGKWAQGRMGDADFVNVMVIAVLTCLAGSTRGRRNADILATIEKIAATGADAYVERL
jgi:AcrR family transcriptional regulator